ncbi:MAG TPA: VOC family protein [Pseudobdellovibrionaceae bacterium]|nr:VOC family protein [Pseudobdellovibrionaceae bacterium]
MENMDQLVGFSHPMLYVNDFARAVRWYQDVLGFKVRHESPGAYASLYHEKMKFRLDLHPSEADSKDVGFGPILYFATSNIDHTLTSLRERGVKVSEARREGGSPRFASFWDCEGNTLGLEEK